MTDKPPTPAEALKEIDALIYVIESAVRNSEGPPNHQIVLAALNGVTAALPAAQAQEALIRELVGALDKAHSAMWDAHYGKGIAVEYAQKVDGVTTAALARAKEAGFHD